MKKLIVVALVASSTAAHAAIVIVRPVIAPRAPVVTPRPAPAPKPATPAPKVAPKPAEPVKVTPAPAITPPWWLFWAGWMASSSPAVAKECNPDKDKDCK